ncbi:hypothetical protein GQ602_005888 [Ophiocordyceps camponoti-floridani]|uniref:Uncharacterized protein n=1 Tax=Ophiocordyceps camponoti-floridani TaxID=2030778 RepID=A0A8H4VB98_9HYPO|nr:hypothetical protein GQ602_005888 [Ophiocordyceps camponoti-floridani]
MAETTDNPPSYDWGDVASLPIHKPPATAPHRAVDIPSDADMGFTDPQNVIYINMEAPGLGERFKTRIEELEQMLQLTHQLATIHAGIQVKQRKAEGVLPNDSETSDDASWKRSQYRARVLDNYFNNGVYPWMFSPWRQGVERTIDVEKSRFHLELLTTMLTGIVIPRPLQKAIEDIFKSIADTIESTTVDKDKRTFWTMLQIYTYDSVRDDLRASLRNVTYEVSQEMHTVTKRKSSETRIRVRFAFNQIDFAFNERTWNSLRRDVERFILDTGIDNITNPPTVDV